MTPAEENLKRDSRLEIFRCWLAALRKQETRTKLHHSTTSTDTCWWASCESQRHRMPYIGLGRMSWLAFTFTLKKTKAFWLKCRQDYQSASCRYRRTLYRSLFHMRHHCLYIREWKVGLASLLALTPFIYTSVGSTPTLLKSRVEPR